MILYLNSELEFPVPFNVIKRLTIVFFMRNERLRTKKKFSPELKMKTRNLHNE